jgi:DNA-binding CsgD family transcriptional regulator
MSTAVLEEVFKMKHEEATAKLQALTPRQKEVAKLIAMGHSSESILEIMGISIKTLAIHRTQVKEKLQTTTGGIGRIWFLGQLGNQLGKRK